MSVTEVPSCLKTQDWFAPAELRVCLMLPRGDVRSRRSAGIYRDLIKSFKNTLLSRQWRAISKNSLSFPLTFVLRGRWSERLREGMCMWKREREREREKTFCQTCVAVLVVFYIWAFGSDSTLVWSKTVCLHTHTLTLAVISHTSQVVRPVTSPLPSKWMCFRFSQSTSCHLDVPCVCVCVLSREYGVHCPLCPPNAMCVFCPHDVTKCVRHLPPLTYTHGVCTCSSKTCQPAMHFSKIILSSKGIVLALRR